jgi:hypothetical protein
MATPKGFERLMANLRAGSCVNEKHANVAGDACSFGILHLDGGGFSQTALLDIRKALD